MGLIGAMLGGSALGALGNLATTAINQAHAVSA